MPIFHDFKVEDNQKKEISLSDYKGKVVLVVNVASKCGFTPQYKGLQKIYDQFHSQGFEILAFPCNQFGGQEPGSNEEIGQFCEMNFGVKFPLMNKVNVNGSETLPLYDWLKKSAPGLLGTEAIKWNFTKFLVSKDGKVLKRYAPNDEPEKIAGDIAQALKS